MSETTAKPEKTPESKVDFIEKDGVVTEIHIKSLLEIPPDLVDKELKPVVGLLTDGINFKVRVERDGKVIIAVTKVEKEYDSKKHGRKLPQLQGTVKTWTSIAHFIKVLAIEADHARKRYEQLKAATTATAIAIGELQDKVDKLQKDKEEYLTLCSTYLEQITGLKKQVAEKRKIIVSDNSKKMFAAGAAFAQRQTHP